MEVLTISIEWMILMTKTKNATKKKKRPGRCFIPIYITIEEEINFDGSGQNIRARPSERLSIRNSDHFIRIGVSTTLKLDNQRTKTECVEAASISYAFKVTCQTKEDFDFRNVRIRIAFNKRFSNRVLYSSL
jgi:hypothetical protein